jgi:hypothetical protein
MPEKVFFNPDQVELGEVDVVEVLLDGDAGTLSFPDFLGDAIGSTIGIGSTVSDLK